MKKIIYILIILIIATFSNNCSSSDSPSDSDEIRMLENAKKSIDSLLTSIWDYGDLSANHIKEANFEEIAVRAALKSTLIRYSELFEMAYVDSNKILRYVEPGEFKDSEGADISYQEHVVKLFETKQRVLSNIFQLVEGYHAVVMETPIIRDDKCLGSVSPIFKPQDLIGSLITEIKNNPVDDFWVMDATGKIIYDTDSSQIGRVVFTDPLYADYPQLHTASNIIIAGESGKTQYSFLNKEKTKTVHKDVWWRTSDYYGTKWKFCIVKERK